LVGLLKSDRQNCWILLKNSNFLLPARFQWLLVTSTLVNSMTYKVVFWLEAVTESSEGTSIEFFNSIVEFCNSAGVMPKSAARTESAGEIWLYDRFTEGLQKPCSLLPPR
jgi:hypothetical protein